MARPLSNEMKSLHKKFIPANIIICIIALIAGISMLIMPWVEMRIHVEGSKLAQFISDNPELSADASDSSGTVAFDTADNTEATAEGGFLKAFVNFLNDFSIDVPIKLHPNKMFKAATGGKEELTEMFNSSIGDNGAEQLLNEVVNELAPGIVQVSLNVTIEQMFAELRDELSAEDMALIESYKDLVTDALDSISEDPSTENAKKQLNKIADVIVAENEDISEEDLSEIRAVIDEIVRQGTKDGKFDYLHLMKNIDVDAIEKAVNNSSSSATPSMIKGVTATTNGFAVKYETAEGDTASSDNPLNAMLELLENPGALLADNLDEETVAMFNTVFLVLTVVFVGIPAGLCFILALCSVIRIFTNKKRVRYWYVSLILFVSGFTILALNLISNVVLPTLLASMSAGTEISTLLSAFSITFLGSGVVNGICWLALTILSLFYYGRVKRKIAKQKRFERNNPSVAVA